jgi:hypothetical protein
MQRHPRPDEVRRDGDCYVIGGTVAAIELD